ncbi:MAG: cation transporter [Spirochaetes bacterium]|nr:cation transporter [Spirochaetota bacterium]
MHIHANKTSGQKSIDKKLFFVIILNIIITLSEIIGGLISGSLALLSDAFHNFSDVFSFVISFVAIKFSKRAKDESKTFGYKRAEILAALFNILTLFAACGYIIYEAVKRFITPQPINAPIMILITVIGLLGNAFSIFIIRKDVKSSINIKSSFLHLLGDTFSSIGVLLVALILLLLPKFYILDQIISILIALYIIKESFSIFFESINILMQGSPKNIEIKKIIKRLLNEKKLNIIDIHHIHLWSLSPDETIFDCHVVINEKNIENINEKIAMINEILVCEFNINHSTIQIETKGHNHSVSCNI